MHQVKNILELDEKSLPIAIGNLLRINNFDVEYSVKIAGAEIDIIAKPRGNPFSSKLYIEATVQYVDNTKYGKDTTKFVLIKAKDPTAICLCISAKGFTPDVVERARESSILTETYVEFFRKFEQFSDYVTSVASSPEILDLVNTYEPPLLSDKAGTEPAVEWFEEWLSSEDNMNWIVLLGEYGTGKTALTKYLQHSWLKSYSINPTQRIPLRIELRDFTRQFDANSLLHHFLDKNSLSHIPIDYLRHLIRSGRIVLLLDGYDEMAQFMNARERRTCLSALASLAAEGVKGILTSRPNYFTESEELSVFEALYATLERGHYHLGVNDNDALIEEQLVDRLLEQYILNKKERSLRDLDPAQTKNLIQRKLGDDPRGQAIVMGILSNVFRQESDGTHQSLSGKPVIISYLLELIEELKTDDAIKQPRPVELTEFAIYKMIVDRLMIRDFRRSPTLNPERRRSALQRLAVVLSQRDTPSATEEDFFSIIDDVFKPELLRQVGEEKRSYRDQLFQDLRSSATLTRHESIGGNPSGSWRFSHNSLREYLVVERIISSLQIESAFRHQVSVSDVMRQFFAARQPKAVEASLAKIKQFWASKESLSASVFLSVAWHALEDRKSGLVEALKEICGDSAIGRVDLSDITLTRLEVMGEKPNHKIILKGDGSLFNMVNFESLDLSGSSFESCMFDATDFTSCTLSGASFSGSIFFGGLIHDVNVTGADFRGLDRTSEFYVFKPGSSGASLMSGDAAIGYLRYHGAITDDVGDYFIAAHHPKFPIVHKICYNISDQRKSQLLGLTQRGIAKTDPVFARDFVNFLSARSIVEVNQHNLVSVTDDGRGQITRLIDHQELFPGLAEFLGMK